MKQSHRTSKIASKQKLMLPWIKCRKIINWLINHSSHYYCEIHRMQWHNFFHYSTCISCTAKKSFCSRAWLFLMNLKGKREDKTQRERKKSFTSGLNKLIRHNPHDNHRNKLIKFHSDMHFGLRLVPAFFSMRNIQCSTVVLIILATKMHTTFFI